MNTMHYSTVDQNGNSVLYVYLKPRANYAGNSTNKDTVFNISLPGVGLGNANVDVYDIGPNLRSYYRSALEDGSIENVYFGADVINQYSQYSQTISGKSTQDGGYQIKFPSSRFANDWGFMVKVTADLGTKESETLNYKWEVDGNPNDSHIEQNVTLNKTKQANGIPTVTITNEEFVKSPIEVTKFANSFNTDGKRTRLAGAEFVLKDSEGNLIANKVTDENGNVSFDEFPPGVYRLEEVSAPNGYQKSNVYFEVTVNESKEVSYVAKFLSGSGQPVIGVDYWIEKGEETQTDNKATVTSVNQRLEYNENKGNSWGTKTEVWEAYMNESLKYHADITLNNVSPGSRFEIQFDPNLDFTQYFSDFPKIGKDGKDIADPYFDYNTNLLTYVFNNNSDSYATTTVTIDLKGMIPDKYYFQNSGTKNFSVTVAPGTTGENKISKDINADYGSYDTAIGQPSQAYYFRDIYKGDDGEWYVTAIAYFNPLADSTATKTLQFNWMSTNYDKNKLITRHEGKGHKPAFDLVDVKVYETEPNLSSVKVPGSDYSVPVNYNMPLSFGVRPEQDQNTYTLLYSTGINPGSKTTSSQNGVTLEYDPSKIITSGGIHTSYPLRVKLPPISGKKEGFIVEQKFKVTDMKDFINLSRLFYMNNGTNYKHYGFESAFLNSANSNTASADQTGVEIPKYYKEAVGLINRKYEPGNFKITKLNHANKGEKLSGAIFVLRPENGNPIYRTSDSNGEISFEGLAPGRYVLEEFRAPTGYQKTDKQWQVIVFNDGNVRITESSITGSDQTYQGKEINIEVTNKPEGKDFVVYKKDGNGQPLPNAEFKLAKQGDETFERTASSDVNGLVNFGQLQNGTYIIEEINPPAGYKKLDKKWVLVIDADGKRVYNYRNRTSEDKNKNLLSEANTKWINVKDRSKDGWGYNDNRTTGWVANSTRPFKLGTRIVAINKEGKYVIQRYVLNPQAATIKATTATIHREKPHDPNMTWYAGTEEYKVYKLEKPVTGYISDMRLDDFGATDITDSVSKSAQSVDGKYGEPKRLKLDFPATEKPIVIDVKIPYDLETGGVGTGMDWTEGDTTYWKSDFYERVDLIKEAGLVNPTTEDEQTSIIGAYISEDSLDVTNELKTYGFKIKKVNDDKTNPQAVPGAKFKLTDSDGNAKEMITGSDGMISFDGLKPGTYTLEETEAAPGYEKPDTTWTVRITSFGKVYIKDNTTKTGPQNPEVNLKIVPVSSNPSSNRIRQYLANNSSSLHGVDTGLEFGPEMVDTALRAGTEFTIDTPSATKMYGGTEVNTTVKHLGSGKFEIEIHLTNKSDGSGYRGPIFELKFNDNFTFVDGSIETWKGEYKSDENRWHAGYLPDENKIGMRDRQPIIGPRQTAKIKFQVQAKADLAAGNYSLIQPITYRHDETKKQFTIEPPTVTKTGPVITYAEKEVRTEIPIPAEATRRANPDMYEGDQREVFAGKAGYKIDIYKYKYIDGVEQANPEFVRNKETINAEPKIIEYGTKKKGPEQRTSDPVTITEEIPFEIQETIYNNLKPGEVVVDTEGKNGSVQYKYSITYEKSEGESIQRPADWPANAPVAAPQPGERVTSYNKIEVEGSRVAPTTQIVRKGPAGAEEGEKEIKPGEAAQITNKKVGITPKVIKTDSYGTKLEGATFIIKKMTNEKYDTVDDTFQVLKGTSDANGNVIFKDEEGNVVKLGKGYYVMTEEKSPDGYKRITAPWKMEVKDDGGRMYSVYRGPEDTPSSFIDDNETNAEAKLEITAKNPKNEISFKKINSEGEALEGAKFALVKYNETSKEWTEVESSEKTTGEDGLVKYEKLAPGKYALIEIQAPTGYNKIEGHIEEFTVDKDGIITREVTRPKGSDAPVGTTPEDGTQPDTPEPGTGTTTQSLRENVLNTVANAVNKAVEALTGEETETVNEPIGSDPINVVNYKNIEFVKVDGDDNTKTLAGAVFEIHYKENKDGEYAALTKKVTEEGKEVDKPITVTSVKDGKFKLPISKDGYYALVETKAPEGYSKFPGKIREFKLESGSISVLEKDPLKASLTRGKKGQITSQVLSVDKDNNTFTQRIIINPKHENLTDINNTSYLRIFENGWSITPKSNTEIGGRRIKVALLKADPGENEKKSLGELEESEFKSYNAVEYGIPGNNNGSRYSLKELLGKGDETSDVSTTDTIVVEYTGTLAKDTTKVDQKAELIIDNKILDNADYSLDIDSLSSTGPIYVDVDKSNITPIPVENTKVEYPFTGGPGTWIGFAIIGLIVMLGGVLIYTKKKKEPLS